MNFENTKKIFETKRNFFNNFFKFLEEKEFKYVVLRSYRNIENCTIEDDLDILIDDYENEIIKSYLGNLNFSMRKDNFDYLYGAKPHIHYTNKKIDIHLDIVDGLYYCSLNDNTTIVSTDDEISNSILNNRKRYENFFIPSIEDELLHLVSHCFYDKKKFSLKHINTINDLKKKN